MYHTLTLNETIIFLYDATYYDIFDKYILSDKPHQLQNILNIKLNVTQKWKIFILAQFT